MRSARFSQAEAAMTRKQQPKGRGKPKPKCTTATAAAWPVMASQRRRTSVSRRRCRPSRARSIGFDIGHVRKDKAGCAGAVQEQRPGRLAMSG